MRYFIFTLFFALIGLSNTNAQILKNTLLNLNAGGKVYDVAYDKSHNVYYIVGDFTSVAGNPRKNFAVINGNTMNLMGANPIASMDGVIRSVELIKSHKYVYLPNGADYVDTIYSVYLGGNFQTINGQTRSCLARISSTYTGQTASATPFALDSYDLHIDPIASPTMDDGIFDMTTDLSISNQATQSLTLVGKFMLSTGVGAPYYTWLNDNDDLYNFARLTHTLNNPQVLSYVLEAPLSSSITDLNSPPFYDISYTYEGLLLTENSPTTPIHARVYALGSTNGQGSIIRTYSNVNNINSIGRESTVWINSLGDTTLWVGRSANNTMFHSSLSENAGLIDSYTVRDLVSYNGDLYNTVQNNNTFIASLGKTTNGTQPIAASNLTLFDNAAFQKKLHCQQDRLFLSDAGLTSVNGVPRVGLAVFCLEPIDSKPYTASDASVCQTDIQTYAIDPVAFADGYRWVYSGSGALYRITSSGNAWQPLSTIHLSATNANSIDILFPAGSTSGAITVTPYSVCNSASDYQYSQGQTLFITVNARPTITLAPHYSLDCYADTVLMVAQSSMPNVTYSWTYPTSAAATLNDTLIVAQGTNFSDSSFYVVVVTNPTTGCFNSDSTYFTTDLIATPILQSAITTNPLEFTCLTDSMAIQSNILGATVTWTNPSEAGTFSDPYWINDTTFPSGDLTVYATYLSNGCSTQANWADIVDNRDEADGDLIGYTYIGGGTPIVTLTCDNPSITVQCTVTAPFLANSTAQWLDANDVPTGSDLITFTQADANGTNSIIRKFRTFNNDNGCTRDVSVLVICDFVKPLIPPLANQTMNCSQSEILLSHIPNGSANVVEGWLDGLGAQTGFDTLTVSNIGNYYYQVQSLVNGCSNVDTVSVFQSLDLWLNMPEDTLICPDQVVTIAPSVIGNSETPTYLWSTGSSNPTQTATGGIDSLLYVTVSTPSGCVGTDSTIISITDPVEATVTAYVACLDGSLEVTSVTQGAGGYQFSLDGSPWQTSTNFPGLAFGTYTVSVRDSLGCVYDFTQILDGTAISIEVDFLASTYNEQGDTIVLVNITDFTGLDSIAWGLPANANVYIENDTMVILSILQGGWFDVDIYGYLDTNCVYTKTKSVYFGTEAPFYDETHASKGIQSFTLSPNPTTGQFVVDVVFGTAQNYSIVVTTTLGQPIAGMSASGTGTVANHTMNFPSGTTGIFNVHVIADYDADQQTIMVN